MRCFYPSVLLSNAPTMAIAIMIAITPAIKYVANCDDVAAFEVSEVGVGVGDAETIL